MREIRRGYFMVICVCATLITACGPTAIFSPGHPLDYDSAACRASQNAGSEKLGTDYDSAICKDLGKLSDLEDQYYKATDKDVQKRLRDQWVQILMQDVDELFWQFEGNFSGRSEFAQTMTETAVTGLSAGAAGVTATSGKTAFAVLSATLSGFNTSYAKNVLQQQTIATLFDAARADRVAVDAQIMAGLKLSVDDYSLAMASRDVMRYAQAGSLNAALASINQKVGVTADTANTKRDKSTPGTATLGN